jgi:RNase H-fold protein (predicted Holliday junction resolvase)
MEGTNPKTILAVNPGTHLLGVAVLSGTDLVFTAIKTLKTARMNDRQALVKLEKVIVSFLDRHAPDVLAIEEPLPIQSQRSPLLNRMFNRIKEIGKREKLEVRISRPEVVRRFICKAEKPTKMNTACIIATRYYPWLYRYYEKDLARKWWEDKYWTVLFDAVALGLWALSGRDS